jgi:hypothetical protein
MNDKIEYILQVFTTWHKTNGWSESACLVTSTKAGKSIGFIQVTGKEQTRGYLGRFLKYYDSMYIIYTKLPVREFKNKTKDYTYLPCHGESEFNKIIETLN